MTKEQINELLLKGQFGEYQGFPVMIETHISWVFLCDQFVYKIKKPAQYSFLDFSTLEKRKYFCHREIELNKRLTDEIYLDVQEVTTISGRHFISGKNGEIIDYAVRMKKMDPDKQMDVLLMNNKVTRTDIKNLAERIAIFHKKTDIIFQKDILDVHKKFDDLGEESDYLSKQLNANSKTIISNAVATSYSFVQKNKTLLESRLKADFFRDCHGDLHSRNIFLLPFPQPFDCIEFNDDFRQIDVLNEIAFLCMDLDAFGREDLSDLFLTSYNNLFSSMKTEDDHKLFVYYKSYRSNIRAKVNSLRARNATDDAQRMAALKEADKYLHLMDVYMKEL